jgi:hypothetical protein
MRKRIVGSTVIQGTKANLNEKWLDLEQIATVEVPRNILITRSRRFLTLTAVSAGVRRRPNASKPISRAANQTSPRVPNRGVRCRDSQSLAGECPRERALLQHGMIVPRGELVPPCLCPLNSGVVGSRDPGTRLCLAGASWHVPHLEAIAECVRDPLVVPPV